MLHSAMPFDHTGRAILTEEACRLQQLRCAKLASECGETAAILQHRAALMQGNKMVMYVCI